MAAKLTVLKTNPLPGRESSTRNNLNTPSVVDKGGPIAANKTTVTNAKKNSPPSAAPVSAVASTQTAGNTAPSPSWTPDQMQSFNDAFNTYSSGTAQDLLTLGQAGNPNNDMADAQAHPTGTYGQTLASDAQQHTYDTATTQASAAARGYFNSSIKDGALNSIDATQINNDNAALMQLAALSTSINVDLAKLSNNWGDAQVAHTGEGAANAIAADTGATTPAAAATTPGSNLTAQGLLSAGNGISPNQNQQNTPNVSTGALSAGNAIAPNQNTGIGLLGAGKGASKKQAQQVARNKVKSSLIGAGKGVGQLS